MALIELASGAAGADKNQVPQRMKSNGANVWRVATAGLRLAVVIGIAVGGAAFVPSGAGAGELLSWLPWWTGERTLVMLSMLAWTVLLSLAWVWILRRRLDAQARVIQRQLEMDSALEVRYRDLFMHAYEIVYSHDIEGNITSFNPAAEKLTGYSKEEATRMNVADLVMPDDLELARRMTRRKLAGEGLTVYELRLLSKQGRVMTFDVSSWPVRDHGRVTGVQGIARDVTEKKKEEKRTQVFSELGYQLSAATNALGAARVVAQAADALLGWDAFSLDLYVPDRNRSSCVLNIDLVEGERREVPPAYTDSPPSSASSRVLQEGAKLILRTGNELDPQSLVPFGSLERSASLMFVPIRHRGSAVGVLSVQSYRQQAYSEGNLHTLQALADHCGGALERLRVEEALRATESKFRLLFDSSPLGIAITRRGILLHANPAYLQMIRCNGLDEVVGKSMLANVAPHARALIEDRIARRYSGESVPVSYDSVGLRKDGTEFPFHMHVGLMQLDDGPATVVFVTDSTEQSSLEQQLRQSQKMESVGQLAAGVAHDFNNILNIILAHASMLQDEMAPASPHRQAIIEVAAAAERAADLTRQLLAFSRKQVMRLAILDANEVVAQTVRLLQRLLGEQISLQFNYAPGLLPIEGDISMLEQVLLNLAVNARDAMPNGGRLTISTCSERVLSEHALLHPERANGRWICISVSDTGHGIAPEILPRIFEPFFTTKETGKGTGLGLATVYGIIKQHKGWIDVRSDEKGSAFRILLPRQSRVAERKPVQAASAPTRGGTETILLVEDEPALLGVARAALSQYGYRVFAAANGVEALELWRLHAHEIDLVLTDMVMPDGISGRELAEKLTADRADLRIIFTSGYSIEALQEDFISREGTVFLQKPYRPGLLAQTVRDCLDRPAAKAP